MVHLQYPFLGSRKLVIELARRGLAVNRKRVQRLLRWMGIEAIYPKPRTTRPGFGAGHKVYPYLLGGLEITHPDQVWVADVERHEALQDRAVMKGRRLPFVAAD